MSHINKILLSCFCAAAPLAALAQNSRPASRNVPFQESWARVPGSFKGDDIVALTRQGSVKRGEFEPTAAYRKKFENKRIVLVVDSKNEQQDIIEAEYDPDREQFDIAVSLRNTVTLKATEARKNSHNVQNIFGATSQTYDLIRDIYSIKIMSESLGVQEVLYLGVINSPLSEAPKRKFKLLLIAGWRIGDRHGESGGYYRLEETHMMGDINDPENEIERSHCIYINLESVWIYDEYNGQVIEKIPVKNYDGHILQVQAAVKKYSWDTARELVSEIPENNYYAKGLKKGIERYVNLAEKKREEEITAARKKEEGEKARQIEYERTKVYGPAPDSETIKTNIDKAVLRKFGDKPVTVYRIEKPYKGNLLRDGTAVWVVEVGVRVSNNGKGPPDGYFSVYIRNGDLVGYNSGTI